MFIYRQIRNGKIYMMKLHDKGWIPVSRNWDDTLTIVIPLLVSG
ncbi:hypothetical protein [Wolbachia pipientis]|nr:hypothetical protein [Wolbachia pipientis]